MGCRHNTGFFDSACALCTNNELLERQQKENREFAALADKNAKASREAAESQIRSNEKLARDAADRANRLERAEKERHEEQIRIENKRLNTAKEIQKQELEVAGAKVELDAADKAWNRNPTYENALNYATARIVYYDAIGKDNGFEPEPIPTIFGMYSLYDWEISDEKGAINLSEIRDQWEKAQWLSHVASLGELFSPDDPVLKTINSETAKRLNYVQDTLHSKKNLSLLEERKNALIEEMRFAAERRIKEEQIAAEKWEADRPIREAAEAQRKKGKGIRIIVLISTIFVLLLPLSFPNSRPLLAPVLFILGVKIGRIHISQFFLPNLSEARENWIPKIRVFQMNSAGLVVAIPPTVATAYFSYLLFAAAYKNEIVAIFFSIILGVIFFLYLGERNISRLNKKQSITDFAITLLVELYNYLRHFRSNIGKMFVI
jgi:hypothetical protein